jgi:hypothetical protein
MPCAITRFLLNRFGTGFANTCQKNNFATMNRIFVLVLLAFLSVGFQEEKTSEFPILKNQAFQTGEEVEFHAYYGIFGKIGTCKTKVDKTIHKISGRPCYKIDAFGTTDGVASWFARVNDQWGAYVDTAALVTHVSYRKLQENKYQRDELVNYDHSANKAEVKTLDYKTGIYGDVKHYPVPMHVRDLVAGFMYLRVLNFNKYKKGDTLTVAGFHEDKAYNLNIIYGGKEVIKTSNYGKMLCHKIIPIVPDNKIFDGANSISAWFTADLNQLPVYIKSKMFVGAINVELASFRGLRNPLKIIRD